MYSATNPNNLRNFRALFEAHDTSGEKRDSGGKWTKTGSAESGYETPHPDKYNHSSKSERDHGTYHVVFKHKDKGAGAFHASYTPQGTDEKHQLGAHKSLAEARHAVDTHNSGKKDSTPPGLKSAAPEAPSSPEKPESKTETKPVTAEKSETKAREVVDAHHSAKPSTPSTSATAQPSATPSPLPPANPKPPQKPLEKDSKQYYKGRPDQAEIEKTMDQAQTASQGKEGRYVAYKDKTKYGVHESGTKKPYSIDVEILANYENGHEV